MWRLPMDDGGNARLGPVLGNFEPVSAEARLQQHLGDRLFTDAMVGWPPARQSAGEDLEGVRDRRFDGYAFAHGFDIGGEGHDRLLAFLLLGFSASRLKASSASSQKVSSHCLRSARPSRRTE